jgi:hypothetical protein
MHESLDVLAPPLVNRKTGTKTTNTIIGNEEPVQRTCEHYVTRWNHTRKSTTSFNLAYDEMGWYGGIVTNR